MSAVDVAPQPFDVARARFAIDRGIQRVAWQVTTRLRDNTHPALLEGLRAGEAACAEVARLVGVLAELRRQHRPLNPYDEHFEPICTACGNGCPVPWPCDPYRIANEALTHSQH